MVMIAVVDGQIGTSYFLFLDGAGNSRFVPIRFSHFSPKNLTRDLAVKADLWTKEEEDLGKNLETAVAAIYANSPTHGIGAITAAKRAHNVRAHLYVILSNIRGVTSGTISAIILPLVH